LTTCPDLGFGRIIRNDVLEMVFECIFIGCGFRVWEALVEFDDDACEAIFVEEDFLVIRDFADIAVRSWL
jgi:hypothetical protein